MEITKDKNYLIVKVPLEQMAYDAAEEPIGYVPNLIGVVQKDECSINYLVDKSYKGKDMDIGMPVITFYGGDEEFKELCERLGIGFHRYSICKKCNEPILGTMTFNNNGDEVHAITCE